ncbi:MAG: hypothetical protein JXR78_10830 [Victivallales bacterium]|nr:hypothetical protein [Victivallales bacterium]
MNFKRRKPISSIFILPAMIVFMASGILHSYFHKFHHQIKPQCKCACEQHHHTRKTSETATAKTIAATPVTEQQTSLICPYCNNTLTAMLHPEIYLIPEKQQPLSVINSPRLRARETLHLHRGRGPPSC